MWRRDFGGFRSFFEDESRSLHKKDKHEPHSHGTENHLDSMWRELGISPDDIPDIIISGPIHLPDEGLWFNQAEWEVIKPIDLKDTHVRIRFHKSHSPNLDQRCYRRTEDGKMVPFDGDPSESIHLVTLDKLAEMLGRGFQAAAQGGGAGGLPPM